MTHTRILMMYILLEPLRRPLVNYMSYSVYYSSSCMPAAVPMMYRECVVMACCLDAPVPDESPLQSGIGSTQLLSLETQSANSYLCCGFA